ncbi:MAG TPA: hypothetical protein VIY56_11150 [Vicinamibacterales bacterium]
MTNLVARSLAVCLVAELAGPGTSAARVGGAPVGPGVGQAQGQSQNESVQVSTRVLTVVRVERATRGLVARDAFGILQALTVAPDVALYDELAEGDLISIDSIAAVVVELTPGAALTTVDDTTTRARAEVADPLVTVEQQLRLVVTIDQMDPVAGTVVYHGKDNRRVLRSVQDRALLRGLKPGDVITVTLTREKAVKVTRSPRP